MCERVEDPAPLSGRCPVILKTDMTHLANKGEDRARILAGLYDAVCENVQVLIKPRVSPPKVMLIGGVSRSARIRGNFARFLTARGMELLETTEDEALFLDALGAAMVAAEQESRGADLEALFAPPRAAPSSTSSPRWPTRCSRVHRMTRPATAVLRTARDRRLILGFDIGSTGSKIVALDAETAEAGLGGLRQHQRQSRRRGAGADAALRRRSGEAALPVVACGATGSGREIVGSLLATCYGAEAVYVLNEIAAHAEGALHYDPRVDTIFEIGGQDAKYIRLAEGRVVDAAMNEACSAGTGSFIEEQGRKFAGIDGVAQLGEEALASERGVSLGQHCSVFMAEVIDEAVAAGVENRAIIAGLYDSVVQNYLNRVKGSRSVGEVIFCQGMPFCRRRARRRRGAADGQRGDRAAQPGHGGRAGHRAAGAQGVPGRRPPARRPAALPRRPGRTQGHLRLQVDAGLRRSRQPLPHRSAHDPRRRRARNASPGAAAARSGTKGTGKRKLPDRAPDPVPQREELVERDRRSRSTVRRGRPTIALTDEFQLKGLFPFFATFLYELGFDLLVRRGADQAALKRGIEDANVPFCAPMQQYHGLVSAMAEERPDFLFLPMLRGIEHSAGEPHATVCPIVQGSPDVLRWDLGKRRGLRRRLAGDRHRRGATSSRASSSKSCQRVAAALRVRPATAGTAAYRKARRRAAALRRGVPGVGPAGAGVLPRARHRADRRAGPHLHDLQQGAQLQRAGHPPRAGRDADSGGLLPGGR